MTFTAKRPDVGQLNAQTIRTSKPASPASRAAATESGPDAVPNSGPTKIPARFSGPEAGSTNTMTDGSVRSPM